MPAPLPPITMVSFGIGGSWPVSFASAVVGPESVIWPVRVSKPRRRPTAGSVMMILPCSSEAYTHALPCLKHIARESSAAGMVLAIRVGVVLIGVSCHGVPRTAPSRSALRTRRSHIMSPRPAFIENDRPFDRMADRDGRETEHLLGLGDSRLWIAGVDPAVCSSGRWPQGRAARAAAASRPPRRPHAQGRAPSAAARRGRRSVPLRADSTEERLAPHVATVSTRPPGGLAVGKDLGFLQLYSACFNQDRASSG